MRLLFGESETVAPFVARLIWGEGYEFGPNQAIGVLDKDGTLVAGMVYHQMHLQHGIIEMSGASLTKRWLNKEILHSIHAYPFSIPGVRVVVHHNGPHQTSLHRTLRAYGYQETLIPNLWDEGEPMHTWTLTRADWVTNKFERDRAKRQKEAGVAV